MTWEQLEPLVNKRQTINLYSFLYDLWTRKRDEDSFREALLTKEKAVKALEKLGINVNDIRPEEKKVKYPKKEVSETEKEMTPKIKQLFIGVTEARDKLKEAIKGKEKDLENVDISGVLTPEEISKLRKDIEKLRAWAKEKEIPILTLGNEKIDFQNPVAHSEESKNLSLQKKLKEWTLDPVAIYNYINNLKPKQEKETTDEESEESISERDIEEIKSQLDGMVPEGYGSVSEDVDGNKLYDLSLFNFLRNMKEFLSNRQSNNPTRYFSWLANGVKKAAKIPKYKNEAAKINQMFQTFVKFIEEQTGTKDLLKKSQNQKQEIIKKLIIDMIRDKRIKREHIFNGLFYRDVDSLRKNPRAFEKAVTMVRNLVNSIETGVSDKKEQDSQSSVVGVLFFGPGSGAKSNPAEKELGTKERQINYKDEEIAQDFTDLPSEAYKDSEVYSDIRKLESIIKNLEKVDYSDLAAAKNAIAKNLNDAWVYVHTTGDKSEYKQVSEKIKDVKEVIIEGIKSKVKLTDAAKIAKLLPEKAEYFDAKTNLPKIIEILKENGIKVNPEKSTGLEGQLSLFADLKDEMKLIENIQKSLMRFKDYIKTEENPAKLKSEVEEIISDISTLQESMRETSTAIIHFFNVGAGRQMAIKNKYLKKPKRKKIPKLSNVAAQEVLKLRHEKDDPFKTNETQKQDLVQKKWKGKDILTGKEKNESFRKVIKDLIFD